MSELKEIPIEFIARLITSFKEKGKRSPEITFLYVEHSMDRFDQIWDKAKEADIILVEDVGTDTEHEELLKEAIEFAKDYKNTKLGVKVKELFMDSNRFLYKLAGKVIEEDKELHLIDIPRGGPGEEESKKAGELDKEASDLFFKSELEGSFEKFCLSLDYQSEADEKRESYTKEQIEGLIEKNKDRWQGKKIAIIQGAAHTQVYHDFKSRYPEFSARREFLVRMPFSYPISQELERRKRLFPQKEVPKEEYLRAYLSNYVIFGELYNGRGHSVDDAFGLTAKIARKLTHKEINNYWNRILKAKKGIKSVAIENLEQDKNKTKQDNLSNFLINLRKEIVDKYSYIQL